MNPSARMLRLLSLLQTHRYWPGDELSERLEVSPRTLRRDIDRLRELGYAVDAARGVAGGYQLRAGGSLPPLLLEDEEAVAIAVGLRSSAAGGRQRHGGDVGPGADQGDRADAAAAAPPDGRSALADREPAVGRRPGIDPDVLTTLAQACRDDELVGFSYTAQTERRPHRALGGAAAAGLARPALVPRRLRPRPPGLALVPARPDQRAWTTGQTLPAARAARRGCADVRPVRHPADAAAVRRARGARRRPDGRRRRSPAAGAPCPGRPAGPCWR